MNIKKRKYASYNIFSRLIILVLCVAINATTAIAATDSYNYSVWENAETAPDAYQLERSLYASDLGGSSLNGIKALFVQGDKLYIAANDRVIVTDEAFNKLGEIHGYTLKGEEDQLAAPNGIFVTEEGEVYVADPLKGAILHFDKYYKLIRKLERPEMTGMIGINYQPLKVVVDNIGRIYVLARNAYEGIIELSPEGTFNRYVGANQVSVSVLDIFWRSIATESQLAQMALWLPTDYSDIALDKDGFIFASVQGNDVKDPVRKLNAKGVDILREYQRIKRPAGDIVPTGNTSNITGIACYEDGRFAILDSTRSRIFVYNEEARLLYVFGGFGTTQGQFRNPIDVAFMGDKILVADSITASIEVFSPTEYGKYINEATYYQGQYDYVNAAKAWEKVVQMNPGFSYAYAGIGKQLVREDNYDDAKDAFYKSKDVEYYSSSYAKVRENSLEQNLGQSLIFILAAILILFVVKLFRRNKKKDKLSNPFIEEYLKFPLYILSHPFKAFDEIKYEGKGNNLVCIVILALLCIVNIIRQQSISFMITDYDPYDINSIRIIGTTIFPYLLFVTANWSITTLMDGKGTYKDIFKVSIYPLFPKIFLDLTGILLSNFLIFEEIPIVTMLFGLGTFLYCFYVFIGLVVVHGFSFSKGIGSVILSFVAMAVIVFILLLLITLVGGFVDDISTIIQEFTLLF